jgi:hypothetical protein
MPSPETDWEIVHKAAQGTPSTFLFVRDSQVLMTVLVDHDRLPTPGQTEAARALKRRSSHQPATSSRPPPPELNRRSTVIHKLEKEERKVNGPRSPMPKTPALPQGHEHAHTRRDHTRQGNYTTPLRSPQPMRSPQTPATYWYEYEHTPRGTDCRRSEMGCKCAITKHAYYRWFHPIHKSPWKWSQCTFFHIPPTTP